MNRKNVMQNGKKIAVITGDKKIINDVQSALDLIMTVKFESETNLIAVDKNVIIEDFFVLSKGLAGEVLQKFINYQAKIAIFGDFSKYTSKPLKDFIYESNNGKDIFFTATEAEAIEKLSTAHE
ncbi:MAG: DUF4180 domain-containing protein [Clostridiales bacterium]|jgi:hypothetical protein|nr:DUF4180 domain-containing protein [Clostridiales bacterium]